MTYPSPNLSHAQYSGVVGARRDMTWGRFLFLPPILANPRMIFDPQPFRAQHFLSGKSPKLRVQR